MNQDIQKDKNKPLGEVMSTKGNINFMTGSHEYLLGLSLTHVLDGRLDGSVYVNFVLLNREYSSKEKQKWLLPS